MRRRARRRSRRCMARRARRRRRQTRASWTRRAGGRAVEAGRRGARAPRSGPTLLPARRPSPSPQVDFPSTAPSRHQRPGLRWLEPHATCGRMIDLHYWPTPNGWKIGIMLEECGLPYTVKPVNIGRGEQFMPEFLALSPNNRMPALVDHDPPGGGGPLAIFESAAILQYLAEKSGRFMPRDVRGKYEVLQWVAWQVGYGGPVAGNLNHFASYAKEKVPYAIERFANEMNRLLGVLERRLADRPY